MCCGQISCYSIKGNCLSFISSFIPFHWLWAWGSCNCYLRPREGIYFLRKVEVTTNLSLWMKIWSRAAHGSLPTWKIVWEKNVFYITLDAYTENLALQVNMIILQKTTLSIIIFFVSKIILPYMYTPQAKYQLTSNLKYQKFICSLSL